MDKGGKSHNNNHFTGKKGGKKVRRSGSTRKERGLRRGTAQDKYRQ